MVANIKHQHSQIGVEIDNRGEIGEIGVIAAERFAAASENIERAAALLAAGQPDRAALLLDGLAQQIAAEWFYQQGEPTPAPLYLLAALEERLPELAWQLRLALRAPNVEARIVHCRHLMASLSSQFAVQQARR